MTFSKLWYLDRPYGGMIPEITWACLARTLESGRGKTGSNFFQVPFRTLSSRQGVRVVSPMVLWCLKIDGKLSILWMVSSWYHHLQLILICLTCQSATQLHPAHWRPVIWCFFSLLFPSCVFPISARLSRSYVEQWVCLHTSACWSCCTLFVATQSWITHRQSVTVSARTSHLWVAIFFLRSTSCKTSSGFVRCFESGGDAIGGTAVPPAGT